MVMGELYLVEQQLNVKPDIRKHIENFVNTHDRQIMSLDHAYLHETLHYLLALQITNNVLLVQHRKQITFSQKIN